MNNNGIHKFNRGVKAFGAGAAGFIAVLMIVVIASEIAREPTRWGMICADIAIFAVMIAAAVLITARVASGVESLSFEGENCVIVTGTGKHTVRCSDVTEVEINSRLIGTKPRLVFIRAAVNGRKRTFRMNEVFVPFHRIPINVDVDELRTHFTRAVFR